MSTVPSPQPVRYFDYRTMEHAGERLFTRALLTPKALNALLRQGRGVWMPRQMNRAQNRGYFLFYQPALDEFFVAVCEMGDTSRYYRNVVTVLTEQMFINDRGPVGYPRQLAAVRAVCSAAQYGIWQLTHPDPDHRPKLSHSSGMRIAVQYYENSPEAERCTATTGPNAWGEDVEALCGKGLQGLSCTDELHRILAQLCLSRGILATSIIDVQAWSKRYPGRVELHFDEDRLRQSMNTDAGMAVV